MSTRVKAPPEELIDALYHIPEQGKAEIVHGEIVRMSPTGGKPGRVGGKIYIQLDAYERQTGLGYAFPDNVGFLVDLPDRNSFSPDVAFYMGALAEGDFLQGAPIFAVEVRSKNDYGRQAEQLIRAKIADYFRAGTLVVWDVDALRQQAIRVYRANDPDHPTVYRRGDIAEAEPALPGWRLAVDEIFE
ncbi:MAG: Uma2 family endonuclease [Caldilineaceae bacterium]|nr:Uma2 family endonuclease [Caldilineaceae bacterium]